MRSIIIAGTFLLVGLTQAHETIGPNGGRVVDAGNLHLELVASGNGVDVFVTDVNDKPVAVSGYKGTAVLVIDGKPQRVPLAPASDYRLSGTASIEVPKAVKGAVQLQIPGGASAQGRFQ